jgi:hypothetical protein
MITIFVDFRRFSPIFGENIGVLLKNNVMIKVLRKAVFLTKPAIFSNFFVENIFQIKTSVQDELVKNRPKCCPTRFCQN